MLLIHNLSIDLDFVKNYIKVNLTDHDEDDIIQKMIDDAANDAEIFINRTYAAGAVPAGIETWILRCVARAYEKRGAGMSRQSVGSVTAEYSEEEWQKEKENALYNYRITPGL